MLTVHHITKSYGIHTVLDDISFSLSVRARTGLIGPNGCGKTTLMRILAGIDKPDRGRIAHTRHDLRIGYLSQGFDFTSGQTIGNSLGLMNLFDSSNNPQALEEEIARLALDLSQNPGDVALQTRYDASLANLSANDNQLSALLAPLGLSAYPLDTPVRHLSGGQKTRLMLARVLLNDPNLLLLDEPTNHLDISMLEWLETWLSNFSGAALIVSHDRAFLDNTVENILELDTSSARIKNYSGNYSAYLEQKFIEHEHQFQAFNDQQEQLDQLRAAAQHLRGLTIMKKGGKSDGGDKFATGFFGNRATKNTAGRAKHIEARIEKILNEERIEKPRPAWQLKLDFSSPSHHSKDVLAAQDLSIGYPGYNPILSELNFTIRNGQRIALTGANGAGKTTLVRTIAGKLEPLAGLLKIGMSTRCGYMSQEQELLPPLLSPLQIIQKFSAFNETEARHFLHCFLFAGDEPLRPTGAMSHGERARLQLAMLVAQGCTFLLLDEPINHLDIPARARFEQALVKFEGTILAVVHDRYFIDRFASDVWTVENGQIIH